MLIPHPAPPPGHSCLVPYRDRSKNTPSICLGVFFLGVLKHKSIQIIIFSQLSSHFPVVIVANRYENIYCIDYICISISLNISNLYIDVDVCLLSVLNIPMSISCLSVSLSVCIYIYISVSIEI